MAAAGAVVVAAGCSSSRAPSGDTLRIAIGALASLDPAQARTADERLVAGALYETLTSYQTGNAEAAAGLASSWRYTTDERQFSFTLRSGAHFSNGRPVTAADVKYSLERVAKKGSGSPAVGLLQPVTGWQQFAVDGTANDLVGITTPTASTVRIVLDQPWGQLPSALASPLLSIVAREAVEVDPPTPGISERPVGSGPYRLDGRKGSELLLTATGPLGPRRLDFESYPSASAATDALAAGGVDVAPVAPERVGSLRGVTNLMAPSLTTEYFGLNVRAPDLADLGTRQAIAEAIDRPVLVQAVFGSGARPLTGVTVPGVAGYRPPACGSVCTYDPARASAAIARLSTASHAPQLVVDFPDEGTDPTLARLVAEDLKATGFDVTLRSHSGADYDAFVASGQAEVFAMEWTASYPSTDAFLTPLFASGSPSNHTGVASSDVDADLRTARGTASTAVRDAALQAAENAILALVPVVPIAQLQAHDGVATRVHGFKLAPNGTVDLTAVSLRD